MVGEVKMLAYAFLLLAIAVRFLPFLGPLRFLPHAWHFTPLAASLLYFGARGSRRQLWIPVVLLAATDVVLTKYIYGYPLSFEYLVTWAWYAAILGLGTALRSRAGFWRVVGAALASSVSFFLVSNLSVWVWSGMYPRTISGLALCYQAGIPFFRGTLASDLFFSIAMFEIPVLVGALAAKFDSRNPAAAA
jgi:hypothetical protein